ncbi:hypothetical protein HYC85_022620 [Camellia sinensis]|uniref:Leucine-rich repeat-containing N-terminal plant-type domain-containing protein n=1 Tax=Camellia sinensis TaxID=4442 RepID=A0A7J7GEK1_CAMSI|nr:hypothetical protein HYC85_022620 [Camellia sinensis]
MGKSQVQRYNRASDPTLTQFYLLGTLGGRYLNASMFLPFEELQSLDLSYNGFAGWLENEGF